MSTEDSDVVDQFKKKTVNYELKLIESKLQF